MDLGRARKAFKPISHAIVTLATQVRSDRREAAVHALLLPDGSRRRRRLAAAGRRTAQSVFRQSRCCAAARRCRSFPRKDKPATETIPTSSMTPVQSKNEAA